MRLLMLALLTALLLGLTQSALAAAYQNSFKGTLKAGQTKKLTYTLNNDLDVKIKLQVTSSEKNDAGTVKLTSGGKDGYSGQATGKKAYTATVRLAQGKHTLRLENAGKAAVDYAVTLTGIYPIALDPAEKTLYVGERFTPSVNYAKGLTLTWESSKPAVAAVTAQGKVTAKLGGASWITCKTSEGASARLRVTVKGLTAEKKTLTVGSSAKLKIYGLDDQDTVQWKSSNKDAVTVSNGKIKAVGEGAAVVTATINGSHKSKVTVKTAVAQLNYTEKTIDPGTTLQLKLPGFDAKDLTWTSNNRRVAKVSKTGLVTTTGKGVCIITAKTPAGTKRTARITVLDRLNIPEKFTMMVDEEYQLEAVGVTRKYTWSSSNPKVASISDKGLLKALKAGTTVISCKITGVKTLKATVTVYAAPLTVSLTNLKKSDDGVYSAKFTFKNITCSRTVESFVGMYKIGYKQGNKTAVREAGTDEYQKTLKPGESFSATEEQLQSILPEEYQGAITDISGAYAWRVFFDDGSYWQAE